MAKHFWIFCLDKFLPERIQGDSGTLKWEQKRRFSGQIGDSVLMLQSSKFIAIYTISEVSLNRVIYPQKEVWRISVTLTLIEEFKEPKELSDYLYSFPRIKYFDKNVYRHFLFKYYRMLQLEFDAVVKRRYFCFAFNARDSHKFYASRP